ncbi:unnamed protein product [Aureobasidium uvarum]|uniref:Uncharacterized protein n=1 Tax=Aureobasidium uvarum TaxID=2773716 RepID=A0A9N8KH03_9PEZI|nr:unnamed protein product [Aureobasidium uvarum]
MAGQFFSVFELAFRIVMSVTPPGAIIDLPRHNPISSFLYANVPTRYWKLYHLFAGHRSHRLTMLRKLIFSPETLTLPRPLPTPRALREDETIVWERYEGIDELRYIKRFRSHDKPIHSVYRMCEFICVDEHNQLMIETDYFLARTNWLLEQIADPDEDDPERRALLAATIESLVDAFNEKHDLGVARKDVVVPRQACPKWVGEVPALDRFLDLVREEEEIFESSIARTDPFTLRNIRAHSAHIFNF